MDMRVHVGGDAQRGWSVDIHDGTNHGVYSPEAADAHEALDKAYAMHTEAFPKDGNAYDGEGRATSLAALDKKVSGIESDLADLEESHAERIAKLEDTVRGLSTPAMPLPALLGTSPGTDLTKGYGDNLSKDPTSFAGEMTGSIGSPAEAQKPPSHPYPGTEANDSAGSAPSGGESGTGATTPPPNA